MKIESFAGDEQRVVKLPEGGDYISLAVMPSFVIRNLARQEEAISPFHLSQRHSDDAVPLRQWDYDPPFICL